MSDSRNRTPTEGLAHLNEVAPHTQPNAQTGEPTNDGIDRRNYFDSSFEETA
jgi:hypothetical protein